MKIKLSQIKLDPECQPRVELNSATIDGYAEAMRDGGDFPPLFAVQDGETFYLWDGWHRFHAYKRTGMDAAEVEVTQGTRRDAVLLAAGANPTHGLQRTNQDKRRAVLSLLNDPEWAAWSDREIARRCRVGNAFVGRIRQVVTVSGNSDNFDDLPIEPPNLPLERRPTIERKYIDKHGTQATMAVSKKPVLLSLTAEPPPEREPATGKQRFNRTNDATIGWVQWTWNPVTGCNYGCTYCYAKEIAQRFYGPDGFEPAFHEERLACPNNTNPLMDTPGGDKVFVCSMAELFGSWVPNEWISKVMQAVRDAPQWTFLFLTKNPQRLTSIQWPDNTWVGATVDTQERVKPTEEIMSRVLAPVRFVSVEPMLEPIVFADLSWCDWVIIGAQSAANGLPAFQPPFQWHEALTAQAKEAGCAVYHKANLDLRRTEWPS